MRDRLDELEKTDVVVVTFAQPDELADYRSGLGLPFAVLADTERNIYDRFQLDRGSIREVWNLSTLVLYARLMIQGRRLRKPRHDTQQLGGDFVVGPDSRLEAAFRPRSPDDRPSIDDLFQAVFEAAD